MIEQTPMIESADQFDAIWRAARATRPASLMAEIDPEAERTIRLSLTARLREQFARSRK